MVLDLEYPLSEGVHCLVEAHEIGRKAQANLAGGNILETHDRLIDGSAKSMGVAHAHLSSGRPDLFVLTSGLPWNSPALLPEFNQH